MTARQKIEVKIANVKASIAKYAAMDEPDDEARKQYQADVKQLEVYNEQLAAAITAEGQPDPDDGAARERNALADRASLQRYMTAAPSGRLDGIEHELNAALEIPETDGQGVRVPLELLAPAEDLAARNGLGIEHYADAHTSTTADTRTTERSWTDRLFAGSVLQWAGIRRDMVPSGVATYPITTAGPNPTGTTSKGADVDATALVMGVSELKPQRIGAGITIAAEDAIRVPGLEPALRRDLRNALMAGLERYHIDQVQAGLTPLLITGGADAALNAKTKLGEFVAAIADAVDGIHATTQQGLKLYGAPKFENLLTTETLTTGDAAVLADRMRRLGVMWRWSGHLSAIGNTNGEDDYYLHIVRPVGIADAVACPVWDSFKLIVDAYTQAAAGRTAYRAAAFTAVAVRRADNILARRAQV